MKHTRKLIALLLSIALCLSIALPTLAVSENNTLGITFSASLDKATIQKSSEAQTVVMTLSANQAFKMDGIGFTVIQDSPIEVVSVTGIDFSTTDGDLANGKFGWSSSDSENVTGIQDIANITFTVPANTEADTYTLGVSNLEITSDYGDAWESSASASTTLTITDGSVPASGYIASVSAASQATVDDTVYVTVEANKAFAASELTLTYDSALLTYDSSKSTLNGATVDSAADGTLALADYGTEQSSYKFAFTAIKDGTAAVALTSAKFGTGESAATSDLTEAAISPASASIAIAKKSHTVTLPSDVNGPLFSGNSAVDDGATYTFTVTNPYYDYSVSATIDGQKATINNLGNGNYTVENVTGTLVISGERMPKEYTVTISGETASNSGGKATYTQPYSFVLLPDLAAGTTAGYTYKLTSVTIGGAAYTGYSVTDKTYTIPGTAITGDIVITITKTPVAANQFAVSVDGTGAGDAAVVKTPVNKNESASITLTKDAKYNYAVTAKMGETAAEVASSGNTYTVANVTAPVVFTVVKTLDTSSVATTDYLTQDGTGKNLVTIGGAKLSGQVYTYKGTNMFWSEKYNAYCTVVDKGVTVTAADFALVAGDAVNVVYTGDVNKTGKIDANDAQLVYNIYNVENITDAVTVEKYLRADMNGSMRIDVSDATAIINTVLN